MIYHLLQQLCDCQWHGVQNKDAIPKNSFPQDPSWLLIENADPVLGK